ncbi:hypothetical protein Vretifemale_4871 [Volvox reticuliferus]|uniref:Uncharacterized protein n=1 Tax=Volvox reticuliferus TaxID=1737510 RepID=A0A8J4CAR7_9CHLO|nr:hypothetical protein Vretifemale_4871 [Volvox reticuliferus]
MNVSEWLWNQVGSGPAPQMTVPMQLAQTLRYGENPHQGGEARQVQCHHRRQGWSAAGYGVGPAEPSQLRAHSHRQVWRRPADHRRPSLPPLSAVVLIRSRIRNMPQCAPAT